MRNTTETTASNSKANVAHAPRHWNFESTIQTILQKKDAKVLPQMTHSAKVKTLPQDAHCLTRETQKVRPQLRPKLLSSHVVRASCRWGRMFLRAARNHVLFLCTVGFSHLRLWETPPTPNNTLILTGGVVRGRRRRLDDAFGGAGQQQHQTQEATRYQDERATRCCGARHCCCTMLSAAAAWRGQPWPLAAAAMLPPETHKQGRRQNMSSTWEVLWWYPIIKSFWNM